MKTKMKRWTAWILVFVLLSGIVPDTMHTVYAEEATVETVAAETVTEETIATEEKTDTRTEEQTTEVITETVTESTTETVTEDETEKTTEMCTEQPAEEETAQDMKINSLSLDEDDGWSMYEEDMDVLEAPEAYLICCDGSWGGGYIWYVQPGKSRHYIFCLNKGATLHDAKYTGEPVHGYSGKSAFKKAVALNFFYKTNGNTWSGKKNYGPVQEVIWDETGSAVAQKLTTYIDHAWKLTSLNTSRSSNSTSFNSKLLPISASSAGSADARKTMIKGFSKTKTKVKVNEQTQISLGCDAWKYFADGGYDSDGLVSGGASSGISVTGVYDTDGKATKSTAFVDDKGNLQVKVAEETGKTYDKSNPLTVIMKVNFNYLGADKIRYLKTAEGIQNLTYDTSFATAGYFALQVYADSLPGEDPTRVYINKVDEYGIPVPGCTFELSKSEALGQYAVVDDVITDGSQEDFFEIKEPGSYQIEEVGVPSDDFQINPTVYRFTAVKSIEGTTSKISIIGAENVTAPDGTIRYTYTCENKFNGGGAEVVKYGNVLTGYADGAFTYEKRALPDVGFKFYAAENIYANTTLVFQASEELTAKEWGKDHKAVIGTKTDSSGHLVVSDLPSGSYYCEETEYPSGFSKLPKRYYFQVEAGKTVFVNEEEGGIYNEQAPAVCHVYKVDHDTNEPLGGGEFTIYADVSNKNYDGDAIFSQNDTVPAVIKRDLSTGKETTEDGRWVPLNTVTTRVNGMAEFENLPAGRYLVTETKAPKGYALAEESYIFTHSYDTEQGASGYNFVHTFTDVHTRSYQIIKHKQEAVPADPQQKNMDVYIYEERQAADAVFGIYAEEDIYNTAGDKVYTTDTLVTECTTDEKGIAEWNGAFYAGNYYFKEIKTPDDTRYILDDTKYPFSVSSENSGVLNETPIINKLYKGSIKVIKTDGRTKVPLEGVEFELLDAGQNKLGSFVTDKDGKINIDELPVGRSYYVKETKALKGYHLTDELTEIVITKEDPDHVVEIKNFRSDTRITIKTGTTITGSGGVKTGDFGLLGFILALFMLSSAGVTVCLKKKGILSVRGLSAKGKNFLLLLGLSAGILVIGGLTVKAAAGLTEISTVELTDTDYQGEIYTYALQKQYETSDPEQKIAFEEKLDGLRLDKVAYKTIETILDTKVLVETRDYKDLLVKDESKIEQSIEYNGNTYKLKDVTWSEEPNIEHVRYIKRLGYAASAPAYEDTCEYTYTSPVTKKKNTVTLPFARLEQTDCSWEDGFTATVTFHNLDGEVFKLGSHEFNYNPDNPNFTQSDYTELVKMLGYDASKYRLTSASWSGKPYKDKNGEKCRDATVSGQQYAASYKAVYEDDVKNGYVYTAHVTYEAEVPEEEAKPVYVRQATGYYKAAGVWTNIISFVTEHKAASITGFFALAVLLVMAALWRLGRKKKVSVKETEEE